MLKITSIMFDGMSILIIPVPEDDNNYKVDKSMYEIIGEIRQIDSKTVTTIDFEKLVPNTAIPNTYKVFAFTMLMIEKGCFLKEKEKYIALKLKSKY